MRLHSQKECSIHIEPFYKNEKLDQLLAEPVKRKVIEVLYTPLVLMQTP